MITARSTEAGFVVLTDLKEPLNLPFDDFVAAAEETLTWLDDGTALTPSYAPEAWQRLVAAARPKAVKDFADRPDLLREPEAKAQGQSRGDDDRRAKRRAGPDRTPVGRDRCRACRRLHVGGGGRRQG